ncbi:dystrotelin isoform X2 [Gadus macrocephalus]|uniref:dystrotelin isoform X2 n=1 Tax=Gadus macrocephalus TaxID=80720 RepID=UPI0028CB77C7|nr:dystrotelin isoform X2 [Gadus macrocephalus]
MKIQTVQKHCYMHVVPLRQLLPALRCLDDVEKQEVTREEVTRVLSRMFLNVSQEVPGQVTPQAAELTCQLIYQIYPGGLLLRSVEAALVVLSGDTLTAKHRALVSVAERGSRQRGMITRKSLGTLLGDLRQVLLVVQEGSVFGSVDAAVESCFRGVLTSSVHEDHVLSWLQGEPRLLLWLPTLYRLSVSQSVIHAVRCHACKTFPITGLRYRCMKCVNLHLCQSCFLTDRPTKRHKTTHLVLEYCTQPSWRESLALFAHNARHNLLPRRYSRLKSRGSLLGACPAPPDSTPRLVDSPASQSRHSTANSHDAAGPPLATQEVQTHPQVDAVLVKDVKDLQRDRWLLEQELQVLRLAVQSEQGILEDRCSEMEVTMETLRQHNDQLQRMLSQTLKNPYQPETAAQHRGEEEEEEEEVAVEEREEEEEEEEEEESGEEEEVEEEEREEEEEEKDEREEVLRGEEETERQETDFHSPSRQWGVTSPPASSSEEEPRGHPIRMLDLVKEEEFETYSLLSGAIRELYAETEHQGTCSQEEEAELLLLELVNRTKSALCQKEQTPIDKHHHEHTHPDTQHHEHTHPDTHHHEHTHPDTHHHEQTHSDTRHYEHTQPDTHHYDHTHRFRGGGLYNATAENVPGAVMKMRLLEAAERVHHSLASLVTLVTQAPQI